LLDRSTTKGSAREQIVPSVAERLNWVLTAITHAHRALVRATSEEQLYRTVCEALSTATPFALATVCVAEPPPERAVRIVAAAGKAIDYTTGLVFTWDDSPLGNGPVGRAVRTGEVQFNDDLTADARFGPWRARALEFGLRSSFVLPICLPGGALAALLSVYSEHTTAVDAQQLEQFRRLGEDLGVCIEMLRTRGALQAALERAERQDQQLAVLGRAFENSVAAVMVTDAHNRIALVNPTFEKLFGYRLEELLGRDPALLASGRHGPEYFQSMWAALRAHGRWTGEIVNRDRDGREIACWLSLSAVRNAQQSLTHYIGSYRDVTAQMHSLEAQRREQRITEAIMESMPGVVYFIDRNGRYRRWNRNFLEVSGCTAEQLQHMQALDFIPAEHKAMVREQIERVFSQGEGSIEVPFLTRSGRAIPYLFTGRRLSFAGADFLIGVGIDISTRRAAEQARDAHLQRLQILSRQVLEIQETERQALGRELHDSVAQDVGAVGLNLTILRGKLTPPIDPAIDQRLDDSQKLLEDAALRLRHVMAELRPPGLDEFGLLAALREHAERVARRAGFAVTVRGDEPRPPLSSATAIALFRIAQEALSNVVKHACATHVSVTLEPVDGRTRLEVRDDGLGFDPASRSHGGMGMLTMTERAELIGAHCAVTATPGSGTRVLITVPAPAGPVRT
jgi:PAS domain S-box-containing protein